MKVKLYLEKKKKEKKKETLDLHYLFCPHNNLISSELSIAMIKSLVFMTLLLSLLHFLGKESRVGKLEINFY